MSLTLRMSSRSWRDVVPPEELTEFLHGLKLAHLAIKLLELGYDDVDDFETFDEVACARLRAALGETFILGKLG